MAGGETDLALRIQRGTCVRFWQLYDTWLAGKLTWPQDSEGNCVRFW
jgi:hypothetical protein